VAWFVDPFPPHYQLATEIAEMGNRPTNRRDAELEEDAKHFTG
jgi:hypothetical protein